MKMNYNCGVYSTPYVRVHYRNGLVVNYPFHRRVSEIAAYNQMIASESRFDVLTTYAIYFTFNNYTHQDMVEMDEIINSFKYKGFFRENTTVDPVFEKTVEENPYNPSLSSLLKGKSLYEQTLIILLYINIILMGIFAVIGLMFTGFVILYLMYMLIQYLLDSVEYEETTLLSSLWTGLVGKSLIQCHIEEAELDCECRTQHDCDVVLVEAAFAEFNQCCEECLMSCDLYKLTGCTKYETLSSICKNLGYRIVYNIKDRRMKIYDNDDEVIINAILHFEDFYYNENCSEDCTICEGCLMCKCKDEECECSKIEQARPTHCFDGFYGEGKCRTCRECDKCSCLGEICECKTVKLIKPVEKIEILSFSFFVYLNMFYYVIYSILTNDTSLSSEVLLLSIIPTLIQEPSIETEEPSFEDSFEDIDLSVESDLEQGYENSFDYSEIEIEFDTGSDTLIESSYENSLETPSLDISLLESLKDPESKPELGILYVLGDFINKDLLELSLTGDLDSITEVLEQVKYIIHKLEMINEKGYINDFNIDKVYAIGQIYKRYLKSSSMTSKLDLSRLPVNEQLSFIEWISQIVILDLYKLILLEESILHKHSNETEFYKDLLVSYYTMKDEVKALLHQSVKKYISNTVKVYRDTYVGFDTEYVQVDELTNSLLSVQLNATNRVIVSVPKEITTFDFESYNIGDNEYYQVHKREYLYDEFDMLETEEGKVKDKVKVQWDLINSIITNGIKNINSYDRDYWDYVNLMHSNFACEDIKTVDDGLNIHYMVYKGDNPSLEVSLYKETNKYSFKELFEDIHHLNEKMLRQYVGLNDLLPFIEDVQSYSKNYYNLYEFEILDEPQDTWYCSNLDNDFDLNLLYLKDLYENYEAIGALKLD